MPRTGRPKKEIDQGTFEGLCAIQCTCEEMCAVFGCCEDTLNSWCKKTYKDENGNPMTFSDVFKQKRLAGKASLRHAQFQLAKKNATVAIWLGKQWLGQSDNPVRGEGTGSGYEDDPITASLKQEAENGTL